MNASDLWLQLEPFVVKLLEDGGLVVSGGLVPSPHEMSGTHHTGAIVDAQAPQFFKTDGSRTMTGNIVMASGGLVDTVDVSVLSSDYYNHLTSDSHPIYASADTFGTRWAYGAARLSSGVYVSSPLMGGGSFEFGSDVNIAFDNTPDFTWPGAHIFTSTVDLQGQTTTRHILPEATDTYDLGSSTRLWRKGWLSELDTILFAQNTQVLLGGWFVVSKGEGTLIADLAAADTTCDFGQAMTVGDFIELRSSLAVEYIQVGSLVSGTTYNITRNLDGSGASDWPAGIAYRINGQAGNGRIELNAYTSPRISVLSQGATYNAQTEQGRFGDLNGNWGYSAETYGIAVGQYASGIGNLTYDPTNGLRLRTYSTTVMQFSGDNADITGKLRMPGASSALAIGATPPTAANAGTGLWIDRTGIYSLSSGVQQVKIDATTGKLFFGSGVGTLGADGINITPSSAFEAKRSVTFPNAGYLYGVYNGSLDSKLYLSTAGPTGYSGYLGINSGGGAQAVTDITASCAPVISRLRLTAKADGSRLIEMYADTVSVTGNIYTTGAGTIVASGDLYAASNFILYGGIYNVKNGVGRFVHAYVPLTTGIYLVNGTAMSVGVVGYVLTGYGIPAGAKAVSLLIGAKWGSASDNNYLYALVNATGDWELRIQAEVANIKSWCAGEIAVNGDYIAIGVVGAATTQTYVKITGYYI